jgi:hypothetical protein
MTTINELGYLVETSQDVVAVEASVEEVKVDTTAAQATADAANAAAATAQATATSANAAAATAQATANAALAAAGAGTVTTFTSAAIQAAINALPSTGGFIRLIAGTYVISSTITVNKPNVGIIGADQQASILSSALDAIVLDFQSLAVKFQVSDLTFDGPSHTSLSSSAIHIRLGASGRAHDLAIKGFAIGINNRGGSVDTLVDNVSYGPGAATTAGTFVFSQIDTPAGPDNAAIHVAHCSVTDCKTRGIEIKYSRPRTILESISFTGQAAGTVCTYIGFSDAATSVLAGVKIDKCNFAGSAAVTAEVTVISTNIGGTLTDVEVSNCSFGMAAAIDHVVANYASAVGHLKLANNTFSTASSFGVNVVNALNPVVVGNRLDATLRLHDTDGASVSGNTITSSGIALLATILGSSSVTGNRIESTSATNAAVTVTTSSNNNVFSANHITSNGGTCISIDNTSLRNTVTGNALISSSGALVVTLTGGTSITSNRGYQTGGTATNALIQVTTAGNAIVSNNNLEISGTSTSTGIALTSSSQTTLSGNNVYAKDGFAVSLSGGCPRCAVVGNVFGSTGVANAGNNDGGLNTFTSFGNQIDGGWDSPTGILGGPTDTAVFDAATAF